MTPHPAVTVSRLVEEIVEAVGVGDDGRIDRLLVLLSERAGVAELFELRARLTQPGRSTAASSCPRIVDAQHSSAFEQPVEGVHSR
ncbi:hypothetical protein [Streptomyces goshikiensis]|uniref:hypothetical protein n=1 Tax=Streptomyces goshikiensis TaxID=1942 RepID=UPI003822B3FB